MPQGIIEKIELKGLFGRYDHVIPSDGKMSSPAILYGDNGVGKSTILNMVFHLLSAAGNKGHRTALRKIPFSKVSVSLSNGSILTAERQEDGEDDDIMLLQVWDGGQLKAEWHQTGRKRTESYDYYDEDLIIRNRHYRLLTHRERVPETIRSKKESGSKDSTDSHVKRGEREYLQALEACAPAMFYLNADRKLDSDKVADPGEELEFRQAVMKRELKRATDILQASRAISLKQALANASSWVNSRAVKSANLGSENVHSVYEKVVGQLAVDYRPEDVEVSDEEINILISGLDKIERDTKNFAQYELTSRLSMEKFRQSLRTGNKATDSISARLIGPYLRSLASRLEAVEPIYDVLNNFVTTMNGFLTRKSISYKLSVGFIVQDDLMNQLDASCLSSGEQQLLLIFSYVMATRDTPSVFIIDEPEISLNIKWQRKMVKSLMDVAKGSQVQFILASHSIELITQHMGSVVMVEPEK